MVHAMKPRSFSPVDRAIGYLDDAMRLVFGATPAALRPNPAATATASKLGEADRALAVRLMRVNHSGEICAQALYQGQAMSARRAPVRQQMERAAAEENDHLHWTATRLHALHGRTSYLNPLWYAGSFAIGAVAGAMGDRWSLGFLAETERQVVQHLEDHLERLPAEDTESRAILQQMRIDEGQHATGALAAGGARLPYPIRQLMRFTSRLMTRTAYWI
jgi:3-demethoxyubiquinol 3-hydroxylase